MKFTKHIKMAGMGSSVQDCRLSEKGLFSISDRSMTLLNYPKSINIYAGEDKETWAIKPLNNFSGYRVSRHQEMNAYTSSLKGFMKANNIKSGNYIPEEIEDGMFIMIKQN